MIGRSRLKCSDIPPKNFMFFCYRISSFPPLLCQRTPSPAWPKDPHERKSRRGPWSYRSKRQWHEPSQTELVPYHRLKHHMWCFYPVQTIPGWNMNHAVMPWLRVAVSWDLLLMSTCSKSNRIPANHRFLVTCDMRYATCDALRHDKKPSGHNTLLKFNWKKQELNPSMPSPI
jgi:hypothetical protein